MPSQLDFEGLAAYLLSRSRDLLPRWLPGGRLQGAEYVCSNLQGGSETASCSTNINTGLWGDFSTGEKGGDLISLYAAIHRIKQGEAAKILAAECSYNLKPGATVAAAVQAARPAKKPVEVLKMPPEGTPAPNMGKPSAAWCYRSDLGHPLYYIARYDTLKEGAVEKNILPFIWDGLKWVSRHPPAPTPIFNLHLLRDNPTLPVLLVEGEKCAIAAMQLVGDRYVVTCWEGGALSWAKAGWKALHGREVVCWPDADSRARHSKAHPSQPGEVKAYEDQPGPAAMNGIAKLLAPYCQVKIINVKDLYEKGADGWDCADALAEGWGWDEFYNWAKPRLETFIMPAPAPAGVAPAGQLVDFPKTPAVGSPAGVQLTASEDQGMVQLNMQALWVRANVQMMHSGHPVCNLDNVLRVMAAEKAPKVWYDEFHKRTFTTWPKGDVHEWTDKDTLNLMLKFQRDYGFRKVTDEIILKALSVFAHQDTRNEPKDWLASLEWDQVPRCVFFFRDYMKAPKDLYTKAASQNFWISMIARIEDPGCKVDNMVVLQGAEGARKSTALNIIGGQWYTEMMIDLNNLAGFLEVLPGKLIIEISEMDAFKKADATTIKKVITNKVDRYRPPYGRLAEDFKRQCVFVGTTNEMEFLRDMTGNRRFWPIPVGMIDTDRITRDREQLFAEAKALYDSKAPWHLMPEDETREMQESRREKDPWEDIIEDYLVNTNQVTSAFIAKDILNLMTQKLDWNFSKRVGKIMGKLGWVSQSERDPVTKKMTRLWVRKFQVDLTGQ